WSCAIGTRAVTFLPPRVHRVQRVGRVFRVAGPQPGSRRQYAARDAGALLIALCGRGRNVLLRRAESEGDVAGEAVRHHREHGPVVPRPRGHLPVLARANREEVASVVFERLLQPMLGRGKALAVVDPRPRHVLLLVPAVAVAANAEEDDQV